MVATAACLAGLELARWVRPLFGPLRRGEKTREPEFRLPLHIFPTSICAKSSKQKSCGFLTSSMPRKIFKIKNLHVKYSTIRI